MHGVARRARKEHRMKQYLELVQTILDTGSWQENRTGIRTISMPGAMLRFDLQQGFPAVTTKKLAFKSAIGELVGFLRASRSAAQFRALGCKGWDANAKDPTTSVRCTACSGANGPRTRCSTRPRARSSRTRRRGASSRSPSSKRA